MRKTLNTIFTVAATLAFAIPAPAIAQSVDFGDDASRFSKDGECDDMRFSGAGMTSTTLIDSDIRHDATDCRTAYRGAGVLAVLPLVADAVRKEGGCKW